MSTPARKTSNASQGASDLRGLGRLGIDAVTGVTDLVEAMHANILALPGPFGTAAATRTRGIPGLVYRSVRGVTRLVGSGIDGAVSGLSSLLGPVASLPQREALVAALNGVLGDHLAASGNPLAIEMQLRHAGQTLPLATPALADAMPAATPRVLVLAHGLCMNDLQWHANGHHHGAALARDLGYSVVHLHYNTGLPISDNGRALSALLQQLVDRWPVAVEELAIVGHSMGGLVARSACLTADAEGADWSARLRKLVFLGTPHHGAPLERAGNWVDQLIGLSPYTQPFTRLGRIRSAGIRDLRHGHVRDEDRRDRDAGGHRDGRVPAPLPAHVKAYAIAGTSQAPRADGSVAGLRSDGLVPVASAFGQHPDRRLALRIPAARRALVYRTNHLQLLGSAEVYARLRHWLA